MGGVGMMLGPRTWSGGILPYALPSFPSCTRRTGEQCCTAVPRTMEFKSPRAEDKKLELESVG
eukprot:scaffold535_cov260-Pinguiococcus_pyrenoidosus.AAC.38